MPVGGSAVSDRPAQVTLGTGHPPGGNAIEADPRTAAGDPSFRVHGYEKLYVCNASVFPTSITVSLSRR